MKLGALLLVGSLFVIGCGEKDEPPPKDSGEADADTDADSDTDADADSDADADADSDTDTDPNDADGDGYPLEEDCDDGDAAIHPGASETCDDGVDQDCDLLIDCGDTDCWSEPWCEDCHDGTDDDGDGLIDCEDGDCAGTAYCEELDCADGLDSDEDGLTDCADDDCWATCHPAGVRSRAMGGRLVQDSTYYRYRRNQCSGASCGYYHELQHDHRGELVSVWGTVQVLPYGVSSWSATTARDTCDWRVASVELEATEFWDVDSGFVHNWSAPAPVRGAVSVDSGCRLAGSWFLPDQIALRFGGGHVSNWSSADPWYGLVHYYNLGPAWYRGSTLTSSIDTRTTFYQGSRSWRRRTWTYLHGSIELGSAEQSWLAVP